MLSVEDRAAIMVGLEAGLSQVRIARLIGRSPSVVCREIARHRGPGGVYQAEDAGRAAQVARRRPKKRLLDRNSLLRRRVIFDLSQGRTPRQTSGRLSMEASPATNPTSTPSPTSRATAPEPPSATAPPQKHSTNSLLPPIDTAVLSERFFRPISLTGTDSNMPEKPLNTAFFGGQPLTRDIKTTVSTWVVCGNMSKRRPSTGRSVGMAARSVAREAGLHEE